MTATTVLLVLDGWGHSESSSHNAITSGKTPTWDQLWRDAPHTLISGSGTDVGLPAGQMGNSEVGHMNLGAGRVVQQDLPRITRAIEDGSFATNAVLTSALDGALKATGVVHIFGLASAGGVHSHQDQIIAAAEVAQKAGATVYVHAFLDGRDTPPRSAKSSLEQIQSALAGHGRIASLIGRYYAMDRDNRWERVSRAYAALVQGQAPFRFQHPIDGLDAAYARGESDEFVQPTLIGPRDGGGTVEDRDTVIFMNFRADRARQLTRAFVQDNFEGFQRRTIVHLSAFVTLTRYADDIDAPYLFEAETLANTFGECLSHLGKRQLRIAETEKYAHVTFFFSGGREKPYRGEDRVLIPSPKVATYDLKPEMSAIEVTDKLVAAIRSGTYDAIICNYANADMVGHTGHFDAAVKAVETLDGCLARFIEALRETGGQCLITADHGNVEDMHDPVTGQAHTAHTSGPVPVVYFGPKDVLLESGGTLSDIAPTLLTLMGIPAPGEMTGRSLVISERARHRSGSDSA